ncbi:hypothetical protein G3N94_41795, partial [Burkholderia sp. Ac-20353]|nr:hypothetical protein [Burkholderia sp. Ac-20353]
RSTGTPAPDTAGIAGLLDRFGVLRGTPGDIVAALRADPALAGATELVVQVQTASTPYRDALRRLEGIARHVAPALGWTPAGSLPESVPPTSAPLST